MIDKYVSFLFSMLWRVIRTLPARLEATFLLYFADFRVVEFSAAVGAAFAAVNEFCARIGIPDAKAHQIALFGAAIAAFCFIRNPKTKDWVGRGEPLGDPVPEPDDSDAGSGASADVREELSRAALPGPTRKITPRIPNSYLVAAAKEK